MSIDFRFAERLAVLERRSDDHDTRDEETRRDVAELKDQYSKMITEFKVFEARVITFAFAGSLVGALIINLAFSVIDHLWK